MVISGIMEEEEFEEMLASKKICIVDFSATWCGPCRMMVPVVEDLSEKHKKDYIFYSIDVDSAEDLAEKYNISVVPTFIVFSNGKELGRTSGYMEANELEDFIKSQIK